jgi:hypothetical protein
MIQKNQTKHWFGKLNQTFTLQNPNFAAFPSKKQKFTVQ